LALDRAQHADGARAALLLREVVRHREELACSRGMLDALDAAAAYLRETMQGEPHLTDREIERMAEAVIGPRSAGTVARDDGSVRTLWWPPNPTAADDARFWPSDDAEAERTAFVPGFVPAAPVEPTADTDGALCTGSCIRGDCDCPNREPEPPTVELATTGTMHDGPDGRTEVDPTP